VIRVTVVGSVGIRAVLADCLIIAGGNAGSAGEPQAIAVALPLGGHFATPKVAPVSVSRRPQGVTASPLPETVLVSSVNGFGGEVRKGIEISQPSDDPEPND